MPSLRTAAAPAPEGLIAPAIRYAQSRSILSPVTGFLKEAGFTHSLSPARNCTFGCTYCYVPTMRIYGGLQQEDWRRWGKFTTFKANAPDLVAQESRPNQIVYCSPLVDPYQPAEATEAIMPRLLESLAKHPPAVFVIQTRGPLILRDLAHLRTVARCTKLRVSFSITSDCDRIRKLYEPLCAPLEQRWDTIRQLRDAGIETYAALAPLLPCDPERLASLAIDATGRDLIGDPLHVRAAKPHGATTRESAVRIAAVQDHDAWFVPAFQRQIVQRIRAVAQNAGLNFEVGPLGFGRLARLDPNEVPSTEIL